MEALASCARLFAAAAPPPPGAGEAAAAAGGTPAAGAGAAVLDAVSTLRSLCAGHEANCRRLVDSGGLETAEALLASPDQELACRDEVAALLADLAAAAAAEGGGGAARLRRACGALVDALRRG